MLHKSGAQASRLRAGIGFAPDKSQACVVVVRRNLPAIGRIANELLLLMATLTTLPVCFSNGLLGSISGISDEQCADFE